MSGFFEYVDFYIGWGCEGREGRQGEVFPYIFQKESELEAAIRYGISEHLQ